MHPLQSGWLVFLLLIQSLFAGETAPPTADINLKSLYDQHRWFELRDALPAHKAPELYQGAVAVAFGDARQAEKLLRAVIKASPRSGDADHARAWLISLYYRSGRFPQALAMADERVATQPDNSDFKSQRSFMAALGPYPEQVVTQRRHSLMRYQAYKSGIYIPVSVNGKPANYLVDTAADLSLINASEARRLGMTVRTNDAKGTGAGGSQFDFGTALAAKFQVGNVQLKNVLFFVVPDGQLPFSESPPDKQGILGSTVLQALETVQWKSDGSFEVAFRSKRKNIKQSTLCFDMANPVTRLEFKQRKFALVLDTGSMETVLYPPFAREFSQWLHETAKEGYTEMTGLGGSPKVHCVTAPEMKFQIGKTPVSLQPAKVLLEPTTPSSNYYFGLLGMDILNQVHEVSIDYQAMTFSVK